MEIQNETQKTQFKTIIDVIKFYNFHYSKNEFIDYKLIIPVELDYQFIDDLKFVLKRVGVDDKESFLSEFVIVPFLRKAWRLHEKLDLFSHVSLQTDDYIVIPDYLITGLTKLGYKAVEKPLLVTVEAKFEQFNEGWKQAAMQMVAAQKINETTKIPIYAIVTNGKLWEFGKLENNIIYQHPNSLSIQSPEQVVGILSYIFGECEKNAEL